MKPIMIVLFFWGVLLNAQTPVSLNGRIGATPMKGLVGVELQVSNVSLSVGWKPEAIPYMRGHYDAISSSLTIYSNQWYRSSWYCSIGGTTNGYLYKDFYEYVPEPAVSIIIGYRFNITDVSSLSRLRTFERFFIDCGVGYTKSKNGQRLAYEFAINFSILNNHTKKHPGKYKS